jgi:hypothetical protein
MNAASRRLRYPLFIDILRKQQYLSAIIIQNFFGTREVLHGEQSKKTINM